MGKSTRKTPIGGMTTAPSDKQDKRIANRRFRRKSRLAMSQEREPPFSIRQVSDPWDFNKDGKSRWFGYHPEEEWWRRFMRK